MTRTKLITVALLAVCVLTALAAANAFAAKKGEIVNKEGKALVKGKFVGKSTRTMLWETEAGSKWTCKETSVTGTISTTKGGGETITYTGCESGGFKCKLGSETAGTLIMKATLGLVVKSEKDYWERALEKEVELVCSGIKIKWKGALLLPVSPEEVLKTEFVFAALGEKGKQTPEIGANHFEVEFVKEGAKFEKADINEAELKTTFEEEVKFI